MKESITKFDLEAAFKALDAIDVPTTDGGIVSNRPALTEIFSRKSKFDVLMEEYYDISSTEELSDAKETMEAEVAKAKLARIEKIVDLDAESPEDLLTSYVGKLIIQCPQCMTLFYKNPEDIEESEDDAETVNVNEVCQHCGNDSGYTLIGKVGEATSEETEEMTDDNLDLELEPDGAEAEDTETNEEAAVEETADNSEEDLDIGDLEELDLDIEDDENNDANESFTNTQTAETTTLTEDVELDTSAEEFEKLINSPEFKKPITDKDARSMMQEFEEPSEDNTQTKEAIKETSAEEQEKLTEGIFDALKNKSRSDKADWLLANAKIDYNKVQVDESGECIPDESNQRFSTFMVVRFTNRYSNGKVITMAPSFNNKDLVKGEDKPQLAKKYKEADARAKGWSMQEGKGPAFIFLAKDERDTKPVFLCQYFEGELELDQLDKYVEIVKKSLKGAKLRSKGGETSDNKVTAGKVEVGQHISLKDKKGNDIVAEVISAEKSMFGNGAIDLTIKFENAKTKTFSVAPETVLTIVKEVKTESLNFTELFNDVEELQETSLERLITEHLIDTTDDVAGFKLIDCYYLTEGLKIIGNIYLTSGKKTKASYLLTEAYTATDSKIELRGLVENTDKSISLVGNINTDNKTFITESFKYN